MPGENSIVVPGLHELQPGLLHEQPVLLRVDQLAYVPIGGKLVSGSSRITSASIDAIRI